MRNPILTESAFWDPPRRISAITVLVTLVAAALAAGAETALYLAIVAAPPIACLWAPEIVARFPLAGAMFTARPLSHRSSEPSVVMIGWVLLAVWFLYALLEIASIL